MIETEPVIQLLSDLVAIDSVNPGLVPGAAGEAEIADYVAAWLERRGLQVWRQELAPRRANVVGVLAGSAAGKTLALNAHLDTVGVSGMDDPFNPRVGGDRLYGRGSYDMKGGLAAIMLAVEKLARNGLPSGDVVVMAVGDEEYGSLGTEMALAASRTDAAIVTEPTALEICVAHKGFAWMEIETLGRAAHGSRADLGVDAIAAMGEVLAQFSRRNSELRSRAPHPLLGTPTLHASLIRGGQELSSYPASCLLQAERRTLPGETPTDITNELEGMLRAVEACDPSFRATGNVFFWRDPFEVDVASPIVRVVHDAATHVTGNDPGLGGADAWMDAALLQGAGIPTVVFGPGGAGAHAHEEWVSISQVATCATVLERAARAFCT